MHYKRANQIAAITGKSKKAIRNLCSRHNVPRTIDGFVAWLKVHEAELKRRRAERRKKWAKSPNRIAYLKQRTLSGADAARQRRYAAAHPEKYAPGSKIYEAKKKRRAAAEVKAARCARLRADRINNPAKARAESKAQYYRKRERPEVVLRTRLRNRLVYALRQGGKKAPKVASALALVGCEITELMRYIESLFQPGMAWNNRGRWHIDHIRPVCSFDMFDPEQQRQCFHFTNLQPLWKNENFAKASTIPNDERGRNDSRLAL